MKTRGDDIKEFAMLAHDAQSCRKNISTYKQRLEYIKSLFEVSMSVECPVL